MPLAHVFSEFLAVKQTHSLSVYFDFVHLFPGEKKSKFDVKFDDRSVCKSFLLGCCPHDILSATVCTAYGYITIAGYYQAKI